VATVAARNEYTEYVLELLAPIGPRRTRPFFGGTGLYSGTVRFAMVMESTLYFAVDDHSRAKYELQGMAPFSYLTRNGRVQVRRYFALPEDVLDDPQRLRQWAHEAIDVAAKTKPTQRRAG
jgi:DNA transformation protein and related proteins